MRENGGEKDAMCDLQTNALDTHLARNPSLFFLGQRGDVV
jgi:hypothetical protein